MIAWLGSSFEVPAWVRHNGMAGRCSRMRPHRDVSGREGAPLTPRGCRAAVTRLGRINQLTWGDYVMAKAERNRAYNARARIAQQQAAAQKAEQRRRLLMVAGAAFLVIVIIAAIFVIKGVTTQKQAGGAKLSNSTFAGLTTVPAGTLSKIGTGPLFSPGALKGLTWSQIAGQLGNPNSTVAQNVNGAANYLTAAICKMTNDTPANVCKAEPIPAVQAKI